MADNDVIVFGRVGTIGGIFLALFLILFAVTSLFSTSIPAWPAAIAAGLAGLCILIGR
jgi:hypothetical protein